MNRAVRNRRATTMVVALLGLVLSAAASAAEGPKSTAKALAALKLPASRLDGLDAELAVPKAWLDAAAKEKETIIYGTWNEREFGAMTAPFKERYPFVRLKYDRSGTAGRGTRVLVALAEGR